MLPKKVYNSLNSKQKAAIKAGLGMVKGGGDYKIPTKKKSSGRKNYGTSSGGGEYSIEDYKKKPFKAWGGRAGEYIGSKIGDVFGMGSYAIKQNSILLDQGNTPPQFIGKGSTRIRHREYIADILSGPTVINNATTFNIQGYSINPGLGQAFPWLASVSAQFEEYKIHGMLFQYRPMSGNALTSTNTALGTVILATQYNAADSQFSNKQQMENYEYAQSVVPSNQVMHYVECEPKQTAISTELYIRTAGVPSGQDIRLYDWGTFYIATQGMQAANTNLGELWCTYDVELLKPKLTEGQIGDEILYSHYQLGSGISTSSYLNSPVPTSTSNFFLTFGVSANTITFPSNIIEGSYLLSYSVYGTGGSTAFPSISCTTNCANLALYNSYGQNYIASNGTSVIAGQIAFYIGGPNAKLTWSSGTFPTGITGGDLVITQIDGLAS